MMRKRKSISILSDDCRNLEQSVGGEGAGLLVGDHQCFPDDADHNQGADDDRDADDEDQKDDEDDSQLACCTNLTSIKAAGTKPKVKISLNF